MTQAYDQDADVHLGEINTHVPNWRDLPHDDFDPDDEVLEETPENVTAVLGFDPLEIEGESKNSSVQ